MDQNVYEGPERRREQEAYEAGRRQASTDADIAAHERRLNAINGSIERAARHSRELATGMAHLRDEVRNLAARQVTQESVDQALADRDNKMGAKRWQIIGAGIAFLTMLVMLAGILITLLSQGGHP